MTDDLLTLLREHDLPPRWDGHATVWDGWVTQPALFVCPPPAPRRCTACGSTARSVVNRGWVAVSAITTHDQITRRRDQIALIARIKPRGVAIPKPLAFVRLFAWRCPECRHDQVWDTDTDETWDLDHADYSDEGSKRP